MADQLNMAGMSLQDSQHAPKPGQQNGGFQERSAYIPPHMRGQRGPAPGPPGGFSGPPPGAMNGNGMPPGPKYVSE